MKKKTIQPSLQEAGLERERILSYCGLQGLIPTLWRVQQLADHFHQSEYLWFSSNVGITTRGWRKLEVWAIQDIWVVEITKPYIYVKGIRKAC